MTFDVLQCPRSSVKGQGNSAKKLSDRQIMALFLEIGVAGSNSDVRILNGRGNSSLPELLTI